MHPNPARVQAALDDAGATGRVVELAESARTAAEAAATLGVEVGAIVKSMVFTVEASPLLVLTSGSHTVDTAKVAALLGTGPVRRADPDLVRSATSFPIGGVSPVGHPAPLRTLVDTTLAEHPTLWAAAGTPHAVFPTTYDELLRLTGGTPADVG